MRDGVCGEAVGHIGGRIAWLLHLNGSLLCIVVHGKNRRPKVECIIWLVSHTSGTKTSNIIVVGDG